MKAASVIGESGKETPLYDYCPCLHRTETTIKPVDLNEPLLPFYRFSAILMDVACAKSFVVLIFEAN